MDIKKYLQEKKGAIDKEIEKAIPRRIDEEWLQNALGKADYEYDCEALTKSISEPIWDLLDRGGKRWRPALCLLCCEAVGGKEKEAMPFAPMVELIHTGTLLCDDVEDDSRKRRGKECTHLLFGQDVAINTGCSLYFLPLVSLYRNTEKLEQGKRSRIYDLYAEEMLRVSVGQATDIMWHKGGKEVSEGQYLQMVVNKTGVLARLAAKLGAVLGDAGEKDVEALGKFGEALGVGFQIQDDILELSGKEFRKGKGSAGGDIHEGKRTLLVIKTLEKASEGEGKRLVEILDSHTEQGKEIEEAIGIIEKYGAIGYARERAEQVVEGAWKKVEDILPESGAKETLLSLAQYCTKREI